ncbi:HNH endonuclease [Staphylococcus sp. NRL 18/288]|nr:MULTISPECIES: HNH endonuclease [unclassified Staphylococcus]MCJ1656710.1 HNH endonuclease [Staphylococcus sp. NRL 21/187]MCJ1662462.1 HNH endonuclease [Staphylococcus sp. NRL 18/288]
MAKQLPVYMWEPLFNRLTRISTEYAHKVLGVSPSMLTRYVNNQTYNRKLQCYFVRNELSVKEKRQLIQKLELPNEIWRETKLEGLYASDYARFKAKTKTGYRYYFVFNQKGYPNIKYKGKHYRANRLVYEAFYGHLNKDEVVYSKNGFKYDVRASNLAKTTREELGGITGHKGKRKGIVFVSEKGELLDEFKSTRQAEAITLYNRQTINDCCNNSRNAYHTIGYRAFMWADEFYNGEVS